MQQPNWDNLNLEALEMELRNTLSGAEAERMVWAVERALAVAGIDGDLLGSPSGDSPHSLAAAETSTPRTVFEAYFRRSVSDEEWRDRYAELLA